MTINWNKTHQVELSEGNLVDLLSALDIMIQDLEDQLADETQSNVHSLCEMKLPQLRELRSGLCVELGS